MTGGPGGALADALASEEERLLACVHCGFCLPACPTYNRLGDEADSPRGRLYLMRAVAEGRLDAGSDAFQLHIDRCLGCRACEPVCPSGVPYGHLLERARESAVAARRPPLLTRMALATFASPLRTRVATALARGVRATGLPALVERLPGGRPGTSGGPLQRVRLGAAMLGATARSEVREEAASGEIPEWDAGAEETPVERTPTRDARPAENGAAAESTPRTPVAVLRGCVQEGLYGRVNRATERTLVANGCPVVDVPGQGCCGALHAHAGDLEGARRLARRNVDAFSGTAAEQVVVNAAGCGAVMKEYGTLLEDEPAYRERAERLARSVRDVSEVLAERGPRRGGPVRASVTYDAPCHLLHAQGVEEPPLRVLGSIPGLRLVPLPRADECCGGAGIYGITHPELGGEIGGDKVDAVLSTGASIVATGNPGCMMQIGAGLRLARSEVAVRHPVELLDESYRRGGLYDGEEDA